jgi:two-component system, cell cycle sensor histidine kinase PleC
MTIDTLFRSANMRPPGGKLALDQLRLALRNLKPNCWLMPIFAAIMAVMFARWMPVPTLVRWWAIVSAGGLPLGIICHRFLKEEPGEISGETRWVQTATASYFLFAVSWASFGFIFWRAGDDLNHMLIMLLVAATLAGNSALVGASKPLAVIGYAVYGMTLVALPLLEGGVIYDGLSLMAFVYVCYLAYMSRQIYETARDMLLLRDDKNELIDALKISKTASDSALERAEAASRAKSQFLANMSHELRTPLNAILGFSEMIHSGTVGGNVGKHIEYAQIIHQSGHHLLTLINDILDLAKIEAGGFQLRESLVDLPGLIEECTTLLGAKAQDGHIELSLDLPPALAPVRADERALKQILLNLLSNALKFTPPYGRVVAFARIEPSGDVTFGVSDTGLGIAEEDRARVFQNFGQGRHDVVLVDKGTGLGLPIVKGLIEAHGGSVTLSSRVGDGTCVTATLPASRICPPQILRVAS